MIKVEICVGVGLNQFQLEYVTLWFGEESKPSLVDNSPYNHPKNTEVMLSSRRKFHKVHKPKKRNKEWKDK